MKNIHSQAVAFCEGLYDSDLSDSIWRPVFKYILENHEKLNFEKNKVHTLWTVSGGHLRRKIKDDRLIANVLSVALPGYNGEGLTLYRGECHFLYETGKIGFCWTPKIKVATMFASGLNAIESGGVLLKAYAPTKAIFSSPNEHSAKQMQEFEYTCNPYLLENIEVIDTYKKITDSKGGCSKRGL
ncbi:MAG: hypothetical protein RBR67_18735 [Desulfobacterium sp.]|jgi:hypothetical protein|nr:hypothetical protein [Desulfobacterium sp.]